MLTVIRNEQGTILAACDWLLVDEKGVPSPAPQGKYVFVEQLELSVGVKGLQMIHQIIDDIAIRCPTALSAYWVRRDRMVDGVRGFHRRQLVREKLVYA